MEFLSAIATAIVEKISEYTVGPVVRQISYVTGCKGNLQKLEAEVEKLKAARESVAIEVVEAERRGSKIKPDVQLWLEKVDEITAKTDQFFQDETPAELKCFHGGLCCNLKIRHRISRKSTKLLPEVVQLDEKRGFSGVSCGIRRQEVCGVSTGDYQDFASRRSTLEEIMYELKNPNSKRIGVYGIGGVGKTTLVKQVYRQATVDDKNLFDDVVILLDVKENSDPEVIQKKIVEKLGMKILDNETRDGRASRLCARIKDKKTLVILDDVWEEINLEAVGIPTVATCKILLTSRTRKPLSDMSTDPDFKLDILEDEENWVLFESKAGDVVKDPAIREVATQIAKYCRGLPVLVVTIASTLKKRTCLPPWKDALRRLEESNSQDLTEKAYLGLEWSYRQLNHEELQQFFLLCGIAIQGNKIILRDLLRYGMGLGFLGKVSTLEEARNRVCALVEELKDFCLLIEGDNSEYVRMHDLVRDVANRIAFRDHHMFSLVADGGGHELKEWSEKDFLEKCTIISLSSDKNISRLPEVLQCQALKMLLLQGDGHYGLRTTLPTYFEETKQLNVLAIEILHIPLLPSSFQSLKNVRTLCLQRCNLGDITMVGELSNLEILSFAYSDLEQLPREIAQLTRLRLLDLTDCYTLGVISHGVISSLTSLEDLRMNSFDRWKAEGERSNACPSELKNLSRLTSLHIVIRDVNILPANLFSCFKLETYQIDIGYVGYVYWGIGFETVKTLKIAKSIQLDEGLKMLLKKSHQLYLAGTCGAKNTLDHQLDTEDFQQLKGLVLQDNFDFTYIINRKVVFPSLTALRLNGCHGLRFLLSSSMARSLKELKKLEVESCKIMEEIVSSTRGKEGEENADKLFPKLQYLRLQSLPKLIRLCTSNYIEFSSLEKLELSSCDELESFICDSLNSGEKDREETALQYSLSNEKVVFPSLMTLRVDKCHGLRYLFSSAMARSLKGLQKLKVESCGIMEEIVSSTGGEDGEENMVNLFPKLQSLRLYFLPKLVRFCTSSYIEFSALEELEVSSCYELESFICDSLNSGEKDREETALQYSFFNSKVGCRNLEKLKIQGSRKLKTIWQNQLVAHQDSFCRLKNIDVSMCKLISMFPPSIMVRLNALKTIQIDMCESLKVVFEVMRGSVDDVKAEIAHVDTSSSKPLYCPNLDSVIIGNCNSLQHIFPVAVARGLEQLHKLKVMCCKKLEGIIGEEAEGVTENLPHELVFPYVSSLDFRGLPQLKSFYTIGMHTSKWPSLKQLTFDYNVRCKVFASEVSLFREKHDQMDPESTSRPLFLIQKDSFPQLEELTLGNDMVEIWYGDGPSPADFFPKLKSVCFHKWASFSKQAALLFLDKLQNLEKIEVQCYESDEIFVGEGSGDGSGELYALPCVKFLTLRFMRNLLHLGKSQSGAAAASPVPNLQFLELYECGRLNSLDQSSAIPFRNLTTLKVASCHGLKYLISYSVAKSLVQLKTMKVEFCSSIEVIISTDGDDDAAGNHEIVYFNCPWQYVKLRALQRLQGFSSGNCIVKFPSLETFKVGDDMDLKIDGVKISDWSLKYEY